MLDIVTERWKWYFKSRREIRIRKWLHTAVDVSKFTGKNPPAVSWHGLIAFIIIIFISFRIFLSVLLIGRHTHHPEYDAMLTFVLSSTKPWQIYVKKIIWAKLPIMWKKNISRFSEDMFAYVQVQHSDLKI